jgi:hypothetical protein
LDEDKDNVEIKESNMENSFQKTFGWVVVINRITDNDFTKHDYVYQKKLIEVLNQLTYLIASDREQIRLQKNAQQSASYRA